MLGLGVVHDYVVELAWFAGAGLHHEACERPFFGGQKCTLAVWGFLKFKIALGYVPVTDNFVVNSFYIGADQGVEPAGKSKTSPIGVKAKT